MSDVNKDKNTAEDNVVANTPAGSAPVVSSETGTNANVDDSSQFLHNVLPEKAYLVLTWMIKTVGPAIITLFGVIATATNMANSTVIMTIMQGVILFFAAITGVSNANYTKNVKSSNQ